MKKILIGSNLILLVLFLMAYTDNRKEKQPDPLVQQYQLGINPELARDMLLKYRQDIWRYRDINGNSGKESRSVWFSLGKLKMFIKNIEDNATNLVGKDSSLGLRIYFANYPDSSLIKIKKYDTYFTNHKLPMEYRNHHTIVMVPTIWSSSDGFHYDFDPRDYKSRGYRRGMQDVIHDIMFPGKNNGNPSNADRTSAEIPTVIDKSRAYMIMPDNLDNLRFTSWKPSSARISVNSKQKGSDDGDFFFQDVDFTNGGTLIPPPYPEVGEGNRIASGGIKRIHIPGSGAAFMRWVDNTNDTGWVDVKKGVETIPVKGQPQ